MSRHPARPLVLAVLTLLIALPVGAAHAAGSGSCLDLSFGTSVRNNRVVREQIAGDPVNVLLPSDYATSGRRYPVLYLFHGAVGNQDSWLSLTDLAAFTAPFSGDQAAIVVLPSNDRLVGLPSDWRNGRHRWETWLLQDAIPTIDRRYRTIADGAHRAIAGLSGGGWAALFDGARHPDTFGVIGSFSGHPELPAYRPPAGTTALAGLEELLTVCGGSAPTDKGWFGNVITDEIWWRNATPHDIFPGLGRVHLFRAWGNGVPCNQRDIQDAATGAGRPLTLIEPWVADQNARFTEVMRAAGLADSVDVFPCGVHTYHYFERGLHDFWPFMVNAFGSRSSQPFDYRRADPNFSVWGWRFAADPDRAVEFLDIHDASCHGLTLTGSGMETVTTASCFRPGATVVLSNANESAAVAASDGRLTFTVILGPPHPYQQYTAGAVLAGEDRPGYFGTRKVEFG